MAGREQPLTIVPVPTVAVPETVRHDELVSSLADLWGSAVHDTGKRQRMIERLDSFSDELLEKMWSSIPHDRVEVQISNWGFIGMSIDDGLSESEIRERVELFPLITSNTSYSSATNRVYSLHGYPKFITEEDLSVLDEKTKERCRALLLVGIALTHATVIDPFIEGRPFFVLKDERLVELVINNSDKTEQMVDFIKTRLGRSKNIDLDLMSEALSSGVPALSSGTL